MRADVFIADGVALPMIFRRRRQFRAHACHFCCRRRCFCQPCRFRHGCLLLTHAASAAAPRYAGGAGYGAMPLLMLPQKEHRRHAIYAGAAYAFSCPYRVRSSGGEGEGVSQKVQTTDEITHHHTHDREADWEEEEW